MNGLWKMLNEREQSLVALLALVIGLLIVLSYGEARAASTGSSVMQVGPVTEMLVIHDTGTAQPIERYTGTALTRLEQSVQKAIGESQAKQLAKAQPIIDFPIRTHLKVGKVAKAQRVDRDPARPIHTPFFLVGSDAFSMQWLAQNRAALARIGAVGMLIEAEDADDLKHALEAGETLPIAPIRAGLVAEHYKLSTYPVLVTDRTIEQ